MINHYIPDFIGLIKFFNLSFSVSYNLPLIENIINVFGYLYFEPEDKLFVEYYEGWNARWYNTSLANKTAIKDVSAKYFYYYFSKNFHKRVMSMTAKTSVDSVRMEMIADMTIVFPSVKEQEKIVELFSNLDNTIALHQREPWADK